MGESVSTIVQPAFFIHYDKELRELFPSLDEDKILYVNAHLKSIVSVTDLYGDRTSFVTRIEAPAKGGSTASPFNDCEVRVLLRL